MWHLCHHNAAKVWYAGLTMVNNELKIWQMGALTIVARFELEVLANSLGNNGMNITDKTLWLLLISSGSAICLSTITLVVESLVGL
jgi:hypothetical protein